MADQQSKTDQLLKALSTTGEIIRKLHYLFENENVADMEMTPTDLSTLPADLLNLALSSQTAAQLIHEIYPATWKED